MVWITAYSKVFAMRFFLTVVPSVIKIVACSRVLLAGPKTGARMNFIETLFGIVPDGGSGLLETSFSLLIFCVAAVLLQRRRRKPSRHSART